MSKFNTEAPWAMDKLMDDFGFSLEDAAAIMGNAGHESLGFTKMQEMKPTVKGSRGGYGWFQWTGPRRREFEAYVERNNLDINSKEANYAWLFIELKGPESKAIDKTKRAPTLKDKVVAFEVNFERAGVKHYPSRLVWAQKALDAYKAHKSSPKPVQKPVEAPQKPVEVVPATPVAQPQESLWVKLLKAIREMLR